MTAQKLQRLFHGPVQQSILRALAGASDPLSMQEIAASVYGAKGGPENPEGSLRVVIHHMRPRLAQGGWAIVSTRGPGARHELVRAA